MLQRIRSIPAQPINGADMQARKPLWILVMPAMLFSTLARADYLSMGGAELYDRFCASCHGVAGKGDGPVSKSLNSEVPDLTLIARRQGKFPREQIEKIIDGRFRILAHGTRDMPVWGQALSQAQLGNPDAERGTQLVIRRLLDYVQSLQKPPVERRD
jgi:mono/diheme cytochrome c family protein